MKTKIATTILIAIVLLAIGYTFNYRNSLAQQSQQTQPAAAPKDCDKEIKDKLNQVLSNQADIISRLEDLDRLVRTRKGD